MRKAKLIDSIQKIKEILKKDSNNNILKCRYNNNKNILKQKGKRASKVLREY